MTNSIVKAVSISSTHSFSKQNQASIRLITGLGVEGDAHSGKTVKHRSRMAKDPSQPNLRQVHLMHTELHNELAEKGFSILPGEIGENITTEGIDLLALPQNTLLKIGEQVVIQITGLRNPCHQLDDFQKGLMKAVLERDEEGKLIRKSGIMGIVLTGGFIHPGDAIQIEFPKQPHHPLAPV